MKTNFFRRSFVLALLLVLTGQGCTQGLPPETIAASQPVALNIWSVIDDADVYESVLTNYRALHPNVTINYRRLRLEEYETTLVNALAEDRGPDIFLIHNDWTGKYMPKIRPMPLATRMAYSVLVGTINPKSSWELRTESTIPMKDYRAGYADAVLQDTIRPVNVSADPTVVQLQDRVMGIPTGMDTMALYYNKDLLNAAGIPTPPTFWGQFQEDIKKLTKLGPTGAIVQSGAGIGTAHNVDRASDLITALMVQNGADIADASGRILFGSVPERLAGTRQIPPSYQALQFYTDFANPAKETYTWNNTQPNSLDAFIQGKSAFFFGYSYHLAQIRGSAPKLNLGITQMPQIEGNPTKNVANYWFWAVSKKTKASDAAWNFLNFLAQPANTKTVITAAKRPAALKSQLTAQLNDEDIGVFASQVLTAISWYKGNDPAAKEEALLTLIDQVGSGVPVQDAMGFAVGKINQTVQ